MVVKHIGWTRSAERATERRVEPRFTGNMPVTVTVLGALPQQPPIGGCVEDMSGSALRFRVPLPIDCGAPVKVEGSGLLLLGEIRRSQLIGDVYQVVMEISHTLASVSNIERFHRAAV